MSPQRGTQRGLLHDLSRGADTLAQSSRMALFSMLVVALFATTIGLTIAFFDFRSRTAPDVRDWAWSVAQAEAWSFLRMGHHAVAAPGGQKIAASVMLEMRTEKTDMPQFRKQLRSLELSSLGRGMSVAAVVFILFVGLSVFRGVKLRRDSLIRGGQIVKPAKLASELTRRSLASDVMIGKVPMVAGSETQHLLISGSPGVGKSVLISSILDRVEARGERAIVYDRKGDFVERFFDPSRGDAILNPLDARCPSWTPWVEVKSTTDFDRLANSIIPSAQTSDPYWTEAARSLLSAAMMRMAEEDNQSLVHLLRVLLSGDLEELAELVVGTDAEALLSGENAKMALSVRSTMNTYLRCLRLLPADAKSPFSIRDWASNEAEKGWIFVTSNAAQHDAIKPLISTWLDCAIASILSLPTSRERRIWAVLDELPSLQKLPSLQTGLAEGRGFGFCGILGIQSVSQLQEVYKKEGAETLTGLCSTHVHFRANDPQTAEWISKALLEADTNEANESLSYSATEARDGINLRQDRQVRRLVLPTEVMRLPDLHAYVRLAGHYPIAKTDFQIVDRPARATPAEPADESLAVMAKLRPSKPTVAPDHAEEAAGKCDEAESHTASEITELSPDDDASDNQPAEEVESPSKPKTAAFDLDLPEVC